VVDQHSGFWRAAKAIHDQHDALWSIEQLWNVTTRRLAAYAGVPEADLEGLMQSSTGSGIVTVLADYLTYATGPDELGGVVDQAIHGTFLGPEDARKSIERAKRKHTGAALLGGRTM
jgi:hypothetical protein